MKRLLRSMIKNYFIVPIILAFNVFPANSLIRAQEAEVVEPTPIPAADIVQETEIVSASLNKISTLLTPNENVITIEKELPDYNKTINELKKDPEFKNLARQSARKLDDIKQKWIIYKNKYSDWQDKLQSRAGKLETERTNLLTLKKIWEVTNKAAKTENAPKQLITRIQALLKDINKEESNLRKRLDKIIALQNRISTEDSKIGDILTIIDELKQQKQSEILALDSAPLWQAWETEEEKLDLSQQYSDLMERHSDTIVNFYYNYNYSMIKHAIFFLSLLIFLLILRYYGKNLIVNKEAAAMSSEILSHPFSVSLLVSLLFTRTFYPQAPSVIIELTVLVSFYPIYRLLPRLTIEKVHLAILFLGGIYFVNLFFEMLEDNSFFQRLNLLLLTVIMFLFLVWVLKVRPFKLSQDENKHTKLFSSFLKLLITLSVISFISNLIGNVTLANVITLGTLYSIYMAIVLRTGALVIIGLINLFMSTRWAYVSRIIRLHAKETREKIARFMFFILSIYWIAKTLEFFEIFDFIAGIFINIFSERLQIGDVDISLGDIVIFLVAIWLSLMISRLIRFILEEDILVRMKMPRGVPAAISMLTNYFILGLGFMIALSAAGFDLSKIAILLGALGVGIGFGLQGIVNNFISGLILIFERPIQINDTVAVADLIGTVKRIGIRSSTIRTFDGAEVIVPNANLVSNEVTNWTLSDKLRRIQIKIGVAYGTDPEKVLKILSESTKNHPDVMDNPEPLILFDEFGESSLNFDLRFWTANIDNWLRLKSAMTVELNNAFKKAGIEIPFPQRDLHLRSVDSEVLNKAAGKESSTKKRNTKNSRTDIS